MNVSSRACLALVPAVLAGVLFSQAPAQAKSGLKPGIVPVRVTTNKIPSFHIGRSQVRFGPMTFLGGLEIEGRSRHFGGFSGLEMLEGGRRLLAVADNGLWFTAKVRYSKTGRPEGLAEAGLAPLLDSDGRPLIDKYKSDAEGLAYSNVNGKESLLVSFERGHRIMRFDYDKKFRLRQRGRVLKGAKGFRKLRYNKGLEALAEYPSSTGRKPLLVVIAERARKSKGDIPGWLRRGKWKKFRVKKLGAYQATGAAFLPGGDLLLLERRFNLRHGVGMRIRRIRLDELKKGARINGTVILEANFTYQIDNMEGISVHRNTRGETIVTLISDDNRSILQRTLLLQFRYTEPRSSVSPGELRGASDG